MIDNLIINEPNPFWSYLDEKSFFAWLESIPAVIEVVGDGGGLNVSLRIPLEESSLRDLIALMHRYQIDKRCLRRFCVPENEKWFKDPEKYWYISVFGDA
ncbi:hypothetical protein N8I74_08005 [Chitiniphilus purpureus]|uniref:Uncharacterized protein n=1 Tax=Chitiniphilus purpureus TaxID=2981137 RepID=A0ABY6DT83_9NEIS|nr:hypothetical protein [Chitiniphilus sp. CD1]UXY16943.1 hypothetical protein N8I74_08005 [Chitiniphilus sp. CD1]